MRNLIGGLIGAVLGSWLLIIMMSAIQPAYPPEAAAIWPILAGSHLLSQSLAQLLVPTTVLYYILIWLIIGVIISPFSRSLWNAVRTSIWTGVWTSIFAVISILLLEPDFWNGATRNWDLVILFASTTIIALLALLSATPIVRLLEEIRKETAQPLPEKIETICECGAVFKSKPLLCSECGRKLSAD
ncbi:MAG: hypothetical protein ACFFD6_07050 [Candidatus Thorarchaeota archaeon]